MSENIKEYSKQYIMTYADTEVGDFISYFICGAVSSNINTLEYILKQVNVNTANGIWLDYLGFKIGYPRPYILNTDIPIFTTDIQDIDSGPLALGGFDIGYFLDGAAMIGAIRLPDNLYRERIKIRNAINHETITMNLVLDQVKLITGKVPQISVVEVGKIVITFGERLTAYEKYLFRNGDLVVAAGILLTIEDIDGIVFGESILGFGSYFADYVQESGLQLPTFTLS